MAFASTTTITQLGPYDTLFTVTMADTSGSSGAIDIAGATRIAIQCVVSGTAGTTTVVASNDNTTYAALPTTVAFTASGNKSIALADLGFRLLKLSLATGDATSNHTFKILVSRAR